MNKTTVGIPIVLVGGLAVAIFHALQENFYVPQNVCTVNSKISCQGVFDSGYISVFGVPFWLLGLTWFVVLIPLSYVLLAHGNHWKILFGILNIGNLFTIYLWNIELNIIGIICPVCVFIYCFNYAATIWVAAAYLSRSISAIWYMEQ